MCSVPHSHLSMDPGQLVASFDFVGAIIAISERFLYPQASTLTQNDTGPVGPVTPSIYWSCKIFTGPTFFSLTYNKKEHGIKFTTTLIFINFNFIYFKNIWGHSRGKTF